MLFELSFLGSGPSPQRSIFGLSLHLICVFWLIASVYSQRCVAFFNFGPHSFAIPALLFLSTCSIESKKASLLLLPLLPSSSLSLSLLSRSLEADCIL